MHVEGRMRSILRVFSGYFGVTFGPTLGLLWGGALGVLWGYLGVTLGLLWGYFGGATFGCSEGGSDSVSMRKQYTC